MPPLSDRVDAFPEAATFSEKLGFTEAQRGQVVEALAAAGVRLLPFPFASAVSIVSDVDNSLPSRYAAYVDLLVSDLGLDFGDSTWLLSGKSRAGLPYGLGFLSPGLNQGRSAPPDTFKRTRTLNESVAEYHLGNVDHFHSLMHAGPRAVILKEVVAHGDWAELKVGRLQSEGANHCAGFLVFGVCLIAKGGRPLDVTAVKVLRKDGSCVEDYTEASTRFPWTDKRIFILRRSPERHDEPPSLAAIDAVEVVFSDDEGAENLDSVLLLNTYGDLLVESIEYLRDQYNVEMNLVTEHSGFHFRNPSSSPILDTKLRQEVSEAEDVTQAYNGRLVDPEGRIVFSSDADDPESFARVFPELSRQLGIRFVIPRPATRSVGWDLLDVMSPSPTRSGGGFYWAQRTFPNIVDPGVGRNFDGHSRHATFAKRLARVLEDATTTPGLLWPIYTHLGGLENVKRGEPLIPSPYIERDPLLATQDRISNISGQVQPGDRLWFARASVLYDYALMLRSIVPHVERAGANTINVRSWSDAVLGTRLPLAPSQLYGLTFYVDDPGAAEIFLDGEPVRTFTRNGPDETGRPSVTVAEASIRHTVFDRLDPVRRSGDDAVLEGGHWDWRSDGAERPYGRLSQQQGGSPAGDTPQPARVLIPLHGWSPVGAQALTFEVRRDEATHFAVVFETQTGARFFFGDPEMARHVSDPTATAFVDPGHTRPDAWRTVTLALHAMTWIPGSAPGGPLPSHRLANVTLLCEGAPDSGVAFRRMAFLRPRAVSPQAHKTGLSVGGRLGAAGARGEVRLVSDDPDATPRIAQPDQSGYFHFEAVDPGAYRVWSTTSSGELVDRRGPLVDVAWHVMDLVLDRPMRAREPASVPGNPGEV